MKNILHFESMIRAKVRGISQCAYSVPCTQILDCQYKMCAKRANKRLIKLLAASNVSHWVYGESLKHLAAVILRANLKKKKTHGNFVVEWNLGPLQYALFLSKCISEICANWNISRTWNAIPAIRCLMFMLFNINRACFLFLPFDPTFRAIARIFWTFSNFPV